MARCTSVTKPDGTLMPLRWGRWHVEMMCAAAGAKLDHDPGPFLMDHDPRDVDWPYTMPHDFSVCDIEDREELTFTEGTVLHIWHG